MDKITETYLAQLSDRLHVGTNNSDHEEAVARHNEAVRKFITDVIPIVGSDFSALMVLAEQVAVAAILTAFQTDGRDIDWGSHIHRAVFVAAHSTAIDACITRIMERQAQDWAQPEGHA